MRLVCAQMANDEHAQGALAQKRQPRALVNSLARGLSILDILAREPHGLRVVDVALRLGLAASTASRLLATLRHLGYVEQNRSTKAYSVGWRLRALAVLQSSTSNLIAVAMPKLERLVRETGETAALGKLIGNRIICLAEVESSHPLLLKVGVGSPIDGYRTAMGKTILAHLTTDMVRSYVAEHPPGTAASKTTTDEGGLEEEWDKVRRAGYAVDDEESSMGVRCVAAPVFDYRHELVGAVSIGGAAERLGLGTIPEMARAVVEVAQEVSFELGYRARPHSGGGNMSM